MIRGQLGLVCSDDEHAILGPDPGARSVEMLFGGTGTQAQQPRALARQRTGSASLRGRTPCPDLSCWRGDTLRSPAAEGEKRQKKGQKRGSLTGREDAHLRVNAHFILQFH